MNYSRAINKNRFSSFSRAPNSPILIVATHSKERGADPMEFPDEGLHLATGSELRMIRQILGKKDTSHHWGGLERVVTPEGHILWLCKDHAKEYK